MNKCTVENCVFSRLAAREMAIELIRVPRCCGAFALRSFIYKRASISTWQYRFVQRHRLFIFRPDYFVFSLLLLTFQNSQRTNTDTGLFQNNNASVIKCRTDHGKTLEQDCELTLWGRIEILC